MDFKTMKIVFFYTFFLIKSLVNGNVIFNEHGNKEEKGEKKLILESVLVFFVAITPFIYKLYDYLPETPGDTIHFFGISIGSNGFPDVSTYFWFLIGKIVPLYLLVFWFLTSKEWWYHIIIIPIAMYAFQLFEVLFGSDKNVDVENIWWLLPVCMTIIPFVYFIRVKLYDKYVHGIDLEAMEAELQELKEKPGLKETKTQADNLETEISQNDSFSEEINRKLSTGNIENMLRQLQHRLQDWLHLKF
ncbi:hypothetical protein [Maribacter aestuarii]|uniref:hypothetical protein n=1 Tax=Maribacter aestuarii TaxID=1130723 RepID=UPI0025A576E9|nr:hypothetical protein [Maribacter aestuarii]